MAGKRKPTGMAYQPRKRAKYSTSRRPSLASGMAKRIKGRWSLGNKKEEQKFYDETGNNTGFTTGSTNITYGLLDNIAQGTNDGTRIGAKILVKSLRYKMNLTSNSTTTTQIIPQFFWAIVLDKQPDAANAAFADIFTSVAGSSNLTMRNNINQDRFQILKSGSVYPKDWFMGQNPASTSSYANSFLDIYVPLDIAVRYANSTSVPTTNNLILAVGTNATTNSALSIESSFCRVYFTDA